MTVTIIPARTITQAPLSYRKSVHWLRDPQLAALRDAFTRSISISDERGFDYWAGLHGLPLPMYASTTRSSSCRGTGPTFTSLS
jgi:tyrosinase